MASSRRKWLSETAAKAKPADYGPDGIAQPKPETAPLTDLLNVGARNPFQDEKQRPNRAENIRIVLSRGNEALRITKNGTRLRDVSPANEEF